MSKYVDKFYLMDELYNFKTISHPTAITLNQTKIQLTTVWQTYQLVATIVPDDVLNKNVIWTSSNNSIATVVNWLVKCVTPWNVTITATTEDWGLKTTCTVEWSPETRILTAIQNANMTELTAITKDASLMKVLIWSTKCTDAFIAQNTTLQNATLIANMWSTVTWSSLFSLVGNTYWDDSWSNWVTNAATANSITFFSWGYYSSTSTYWLMYHRTWALAKQGNKGWQRPKSVTASNVEWVSFVWATFWQSWDGYCAYATYKIA